MNTGNGLAIWKTLRTSWVLLAALVGLSSLTSFNAEAQVPCKELGGNQYSCFPHKEVFRTKYDNQEFYSESIAAVAHKASSLAYNNIPGFQACNLGLLTHEINVGPGEETRLHGVGFWEGYTNLNPNPGELVNRATTLWGKSVNSQGKTVWHKCRTHPQAGIFKERMCPPNSGGSAVNYMPDGRSLYMCISKQQQNAFPRKDVPDPSTSRDVNPEGQFSTCNPVAMCGDNRKIVRAIDYTTHSKFPIVWGRTYNHRTGEWRSDFDRSVVNFATNGTTYAYALLRRHDGGEIRFKSTTFLNGKPTDWTVDMGGKLTVLSKFKALYHANGTHLGFRLENFQGEIETYNSKGLLTRVENWNGDGVNLTYTSDDLIHRITEDTGRYIQLSYHNYEVTESQSWDDPNGGPVGPTHTYKYFSARNDALKQTFPSSISDGTTTIRYTYKEIPRQTGNGFNLAYLLETVENGNGETLTYTYGETQPNLPSHYAVPWELTGIIDQTGNRYATYTYANGSVTRVWHGNVGDRLAIEIGANITSPKGIITTFKTSSPGQTSTDYNFGKSAGLTAPSPMLSGRQASEFVYDSYGNPTQIKSFTGSIEQRTYDGPRGLPLTITYAFGTPEAQTKTMTWDPIAPVLTSLAETVRSGTATHTRTTTIDYDSHYRPEEVTVAVDDGSTPRTTSYGYDNDGNLILSVDETGLETTYAYDGQGNLTSQTVGSNTGAPRTTTFGGYDERGYVGWAQDPNGLRMAYAYDGEKRITSVTQSLASQPTGPNRTWAFAYYATGLLQKVTKPDGTWQELLYDTAHRLTETKDYGANDQLIGRTVYTLNTSSEVTAVQRFNADGQVVLTGTSTFDNYGRLDLLKGALNQTTNLDFDLDGRMTKQVNPLMGTTTFTYDALSRLTKTKNPLNGEALMTYGPQDEVLTATDQRGVVTTYTYNGFGEPLTLQSPDRGTWTFAYDAAGRPTTTTDPRGVVATTAYDAFSRPTSRTFSDAGVTGTPAGFEAGTVTHTFTYDTCPNGAGRLCGFSDPTGSTAYSYNAWGETVGKAWTGKAGTPADGVTLSTGYARDPSTGRLTAMTFPSGKVVVWSYGTDGRISGMSYDGQPVVANVQWTAFDTLAGWTWPQATGWSGIHSSVAFTYDLDGRPTAIEDLDERSLVWDNGDRLVGVDDPVDASKSQVYGYDSLDRLTSADIGSWGGAHTFGYDAVGNRTALTDTVTNDGWQYSYGLSNNRMSQRWAVTGGTPGTPLPMSYDAMGNLVNDGLGMSLAYDATGRLTTATKSAAQFTAGYNAQGQRVTKTSTGTSAPGTRLYALDETGRPLGVYVVDSGASNGYRVEEEYVHLDSWRPVAVVRPDPATGMANPKVFPLLTDHLGTPRKVLDGDTGQTRWSWDAKQPFGHELPNETPTSGLTAFTFDLRFPGQRYDHETGLFHNGFRDYHPGLGRYVQSDPLGLEAGWNTYAYGLSSPLKLTDPFGLASQFGVGPSGTVGAGLGIGFSTNFGLSIPDDITQWGCYQIYLSGQMNVMVGIGAYAGAGLSFNGARTEGPLEPISGGTYRYEEANLGWGLAWGASRQGTQNLTSDGTNWGWLRRLFDSEDAKKDYPSNLSIGIFPKKGAGFGGWLGSGYTTGGTLATPTSKKCECQ